MVGPDFFRTTGTQLLSGREFDVRDTPGSPAVAVVNQAFAGHYFGNRSPIGHHVNDATIVGLVEDVKYLDLRQTSPETVYFAASQGTTPEPLTYIVRFGNGEPQYISKMIGHVVKEVGPQFYVIQTTWMTDVLNASILNERALAILSLCFGVIALTLTCIGVFGVIATQVTRRTSEFGIRMALGAQKRDIMSSVLVDIIRVVATGLITGLVAGIFATRLVGAVLFGIHPLDPLSFIGAMTTLAAAALIAAYLPALRALTVNPTEALRVER